MASERAGVVEPEDWARIRPVGPDVPVLADQTEALRSVAMSVAMAAPT